MSWKGVPEETVRLQMERDGKPIGQEEAEIFIEQAHTRAGVLTYAVADELNAFYRSCATDQVPVAISVLSAVMFGANFVETLIEMGVRSGADEEELLALAEKCFPLILRSARKMKQTKD